MECGDTGFTNMPAGTDRVTGFAPDRALRRRVEEDPACFGARATVLLFDVLGLQSVNRAHGRDEGDARIRALAEAMRAGLPGDTAFFRGYEAELIAVCPGRREETLREDVGAVLAAAGGDVLFGAGSTEEYGEGGKDLLQALEEAYCDLRIKKLLNTDSMHSQSLSSLVRALEETDADTEAHVRRTRKAGAALGRRVGLSDAQLSELQLLCLLHDIGKIGVPLEILNKPGRLTDEEWTVLRTHTEKGYKIAMSSDELKPIARMVLCHHERWDGKGYPAGLKGEDIPVLSRVISIVDAYDAMVNDRSYRKALPPEKAQREIRDGAGTQFDPRLAEAFLALLAEQPDLARGEKTGSADVREFLRPVWQEPGAGNTCPIRFCKYLLNEDSVIIRVDDEFAQLTGYSREDAEGKMTQFDLIPPEDLEQYLIQVSNGFAEKDVVYLRHPLRRKDGGLILVACCGERYYDSAAKAIRSEVRVFEI